MNWATNAIKDLRAWKLTKIRPRGNSMTGRIESGELVTLAPVDETSILEENDIVLAKVNGKVYLHLIKDIRFCGNSYVDEFLIGNNKGRINGWTKRKNIYGVVVSIEK